MNNAFGQFSEEALEAAREAWDFKTCERSDGTYYGVPDKSACAQKGAREVKGKRGSKAQEIADIIRKYDSKANRNQGIQVGEQSDGKKGKGWPSNMQPFVSQINHTLDLYNYYDNMRVDAWNAEDDKGALVLLALMKRENGRARKLLDDFPGESGSAKAERNWDKIHRGQIKNTEKRERNMAKYGVKLPDMKPKPTEDVMTMEDAGALLNGLFGSMDPALLGAMRNAPQPTVRTSGFRGRNINDPRGAVTCNGTTCSDNARVWADDTGRGY